MHRDAGPPTLQINTNTKICKRPAGNHMDVQTYYTSTQDILTRGLWLRKYGPHALIVKNICIKPDRYIERWMDGWTYTCIAALDPHTGNDYILKFP